MTVHPGIRGADEGASIGKRDELTEAHPSRKLPPRIAPPDLSIVIVTWNNEREIADCLQSIRRSGDQAFGRSGVQGDLPEYLTCEVFVVDNASRDRTCEIVREQFTEVRLIANADNRGFPAANNQAFELATGRYTLILNPDTILQPDTLQQCVVYLE